MAQVQLLTLSVPGKQMAVLGQDQPFPDHCVTSGQSNVVSLGVQQSRWCLHPTGCHCLSLSGVPCPWEQTGTGSPAPDS